MTITTNNITPDTTSPRVSMKTRQTPLMKHYVETPSDALIIDSAETSSDNATPAHPFYSSVTLGDGLPITFDIGVHRAVGGESDFPNPGEILSAALAGCLDCTTRIIANRMGVPLTHLKVTVDAKVDVRGTLMVDMNVPVGFQHIDVNVEIKSVPGVSDAQLAQLLKAAERCCVVLQTLRNPPAITLNCNSQPL